MSDTKRFTPEDYAQLAAWHEQLAKTVLDPIKPHHVRSAAMLRQAAADAEAFERLTKERDECCPECMQHALDCALEDLKEARAIARRWHEEMGGERDMRLGIDLSLPQHKVDAAIIDSWLKD